MRALKRYQTFFLLLILGMAIGGFALNTTVNPWRVTPTPWTSEKLEPYRAIEISWNRTSKAGLVRSGNWDAAMFGSSRVDIGLDPQHPVFDGMQCANLGLNAGLLVENHAMFRYFIERQTPRLVILAIDAGDLSTPPPRVNNTTSRSRRSIPPVTRSNASSATTWAFPPWPRPSPPSAARSRTSPPSTRRRASGSMPPSRRTSAC